MERMGEVTAVHGDWLEITFCRPADCEKCNACMGGQKQTVLTLQGTAQVGDGAVVALPEGTFLKASALAYAMPLAGLMTGLFLGSALLPASPDLGGGIGAAAGLVLSLTVLAVTERIRRRDPRWKPHLIRIIPKGGT